MKIHSKEILQNLTVNASWVSNNGKNLVLFKRTRKKFFETKSYLGKILNLSGNYDFENISLPINEIIPVITQKEFWSKKELDLLDRQLADFVVKFLVKRVSEMI